MGGLIIKNQQIGIERIGHRILAENQLNLSYEHLGEKIEDADRVHVRYEDNGIVESVTGNEARQIYDKVSRRASYQFVESVDSTKADKDIESQISLADDLDTLVSFHLAYENNQ